MSSLSWTFWQLCWQDMQQCLADHCHFALHVNIEMPAFSVLQSPIDEPVMHFIAKSRYGHWSSSCPAIALSSCMVRWQLRQDQHQRRQAATPLWLAVYLQELVNSFVMIDALTWSCLSWAEGVKAAEEAARRSSRSPAEHDMALRGTVLINIVGQPVRQSWRLTATKAI